MAIKVLIVLDGNYRFEEPAVVPDFTYLTLVNTLTAAGMQVTRAHRDAAGDGDITDFNFATSVNLLDFDVIWLIGYDGRNFPPGFAGNSDGSSLSNAEMGAITAFMDAGGGVFATGDHDSIGSEMCGHIPRVRVMRAWFGEGDDASPMPADFPRNHTVTGVGRADTVQKNELGDYDLDDDGEDDGHVYFENQSDSVPQPIEPVESPAHPILRRGGEDIDIYPDHMHEGQTLGEGELSENHYTHTLPAGVAPGFVEFPQIDGEREPPRVVATGQGLEQTQKYGYSNTFLDEDVSGEKTVNTLCVYDGRKVGVGRVVTGSTFHHYIDINLTGDSRIETPEQMARTGPDAAKGEGFGYEGAGDTFAKIKAVYVNITKWLARPRPRVRLILERSTFSQDEVSGGSIFEGVILVTVDALKPDQFPGGPIDSLMPSQSDLEDWAPTVTVAGASGIDIEPTGIDSDAPGLPDQIQRFTFTYRVRFVDESAFGFAEDFKNFPVQASLSSPAVADPLTDSAWLQLVKSANPFMLDLAADGAKTWLSSDVRVFTVVAGTSKFGVDLPDNASKAQAYAFIREVMGSISVSQFENLSIAQSESALSPFAETTESGKKIYNFAIARVRLSEDSASASQVRVFFRIFTSQTTAALTYKHPEGGEPQEGYKRTTGADPIAIPGVTASGNEWLSFPFFSQQRTSDPEDQTDGDNVQNISSGGSEVSTFFGALIDNNLSDPYVPETPLSGGPNQPLSDLLMGEHQCLVAQIEFAGTPIPDGSRPSTSDKLSQRNLAMSAVANPGLEASRLAFHTFEIEAAPGPITDTLWPDELLLEWLSGVPDGTWTSLHIPGWKAEEVVALADRFYPRHDIRVEDAHTITVPGGGTRYIPVPRSLYRRTGVIIAEFPLGIKKGQRFDLAVRQITNRQRRVPAPPDRSEFIDRKTAEKLVAGLEKPRAKASTRTNSRKKMTLQGSYDLGDNRTLITDLSALDMAGDGAVIVTHPDPKKVEEARRQSGLWRETIGSFQLGVPVSVKEDMLVHHLRLLSVFRWRLAKLRRSSRWHATLRYYVELMIRKVQGLGGDPFGIPVTPDGQIGDAGKPHPGGKPGHKPGEGGGVGTEDPFLEPGEDDWLGETDGLADPDKASAWRVSGKVSGLLYDHFGDAEGFTLETYGGGHVRFFSREAAVMQIARKAWRKRFVVTVMTVSGKSRQVRRLLVRGYPDDH